MIRFHPRKFRYLGPIDYDPQPLNWIKRHQSFASKEWVDGQVRYGLWTQDPTTRNRYTIRGDVSEGMKSITVEIVIFFVEGRVRVRHCHVI